MTNTKNSPQDKRPNRVMRRQSNKRSGLGCLITFVALLVVLAAGIFLLGPRLLAALTGQTATLSPVLNNRAPSAQLAERRARELAQLNGYGWVDQAAGVAHIPIDQAIALVAQNGLPVGVQPTATPDVAAAQTTGTVPADVNYQDHILPIFTQHCGECHGDDDPEEGLELTSYRPALSGSFYGPVIKPGAPDDSYLVEMVVTGKMPKRGDKLSPAEIDTIIAWIEAGAPETGAAAAASEPTTAATTAPTPTTRATKAATPKPKATASVTATKVADPEVATTATPTVTVEVTTSAPISIPQAVVLTGTATVSTAVSTALSTTAETAAAPVDLANVSFSADVLPIFINRCGKCHGEDEPEEGLQLTSHKYVMAGSVYGSVVKPGAPDDSYLAEMIVSGKMPKRGGPLPQEEIDTIIAWIAAGAPDN